MRASTAYFAGAGTIIAAIVLGAGGALLIANIISPTAKQGAEMTRLERRMSPEPIAATATPSEPVLYLAAPQPSAPTTVVAAVPPPAATQAPAQDEAQAVNPASPPAQPAEASVAAQPAAPAPQPATAAAREPAAAPDDALARARDAEVKRAVEKRKAEQRLQWAERRRRRQQQELRAVEERVRDETEPRRVFAAEPVRIEMPQIRLFGPD
jgi:hypothetical protein